MSANKTKRRLEAAMDADNTLVVDRAELDKHLGFSLAHMQYVGLTKTDLRRLEAAGIVKRGMVKVPKGSIYKGFDTQTRYIIVGDANAETPQA